MKFGISGQLNQFGPSPMDYARKIEALGFESLWMGEHIIIPVHETSKSVNGGDIVEVYRHMPNPFIWLAGAAAATTTLKLGTGIILVPQRDPIHLAKDVACLDQLSKGRFLFGVGSGYLKVEADIMGVHPFEERWPRTLEYIRAMKTIWAEEKPSFDGKYVSFPPIYCNPKPYRKPHPPILIGRGAPGQTISLALKNVVEYGDGWQPSYITPEDLKIHLKTLREMCEVAGRDFDAMEINCNVPAVKMGLGDAYDALGQRDATVENAADLIAAYEDAGLKRMLIVVDDAKPETYERNLERIAKGIGLT